MTIYALVCMDDLFKSFKKVSKSMTVSFGNGICSRHLKCESSETMYSALEASAQSTNLLSSGSWIMRWNLKYDSLYRVWGLCAIASTTFFATRAEEYRVMISSYSFRISFDTHKNTYLPWSLPKFYGIYFWKAMLESGNWYLEPHVAFSLSVRGS